MTIALIVAGVVVFLVVDAYLLWRIFGGGNRDAAYGTVPAPGQATVELPAGRVKVVYQEKVTSRGGGDSGPIEFWAPADLDLAVASEASGEPVALEPAGGHHAQSIAGFLPGGPRSRVRVGHLAVPAAGRYRVTVSGGGTGPEPAVLLGR